MTTIAETEHDGSRSRSFWRAAAWMSGALTSFSAMAVAGRQLARLGFSPSQIVLFRSALGLLLLAVLACRRRSSSLRTRHFFLHAARALVHFVGQCAWFAGLASLPLATVFALEFTVPLWATIGAWLLLAERPRQRGAFAILLCLGGVLLIVRPGASIFDAAALVVLASALAYALAHVIARRLSGTESPFAVVFYMSLVQLPLAAVASFSRALPALDGALAWLVTVAFSALCAHYCLIRALSLVEVATVLAFDFLRLPLIALVGLALYGERLDVLVVAGSLLMVAGNWLNAAPARRTAD
jgi:drug/metabolite transporter (DMT)-like permease